MNALEIINFRKKFNLTQPQLAEMVGLSTNTILNYEKGGVITPAKQIFLENFFKNQNNSNEPNEIITNHVHEDQMNDREIIRELNMLLFKKEKEIEHLKRELKACHESDRVPTL